MELQILFTLLSQIISFSFAQNNTAQLATSTAKPLKVLKVGVLTPYDSELGWCTWGALSMAIRYIEQNVAVKGHILNSGSVRFVNSDCSGSTAVGRTAELRMRDEINVIIGVPCSAGKFSILHRPDMPSI